MTTLLDASRQWATRPADERFETVKALRDATSEFAFKTSERELRTTDLRLAIENDEPVVIAPDYKAGLTHWSFGQLCSRLKAPAAFMRTLRPETMATVLNERVAAADGKERLNIFEMPERNRILAATTGSYVRLWNVDIGNRLVKLSEEGWKVPAARPVREGQRGTRIATEADVTSGKEFGIPVHVGDQIAPAGLYLSDRDLFAFMVRPDREILPGLYRGFFVENSEVGAKAFKLTTFLYEGVCGNHIVWGATDIARFSARHVGTVRERSFEKLGAFIQDFIEANTETDRQRIIAASEFLLGKDRDEVVEKAVKMVPELTVKAVGSAYDTAEKLNYVENPRSVWGLVQGLTEIAQDCDYADERTELDRAAGKLLDAVTT